RAQAWEELCREAVPRLKLGGVRFGVARRFWLGAGPEWDIVAASEDGTTLLLGEASWSGNDLDREFEALRAKGVPPLAHRPDRIVHALFVPRRPGRRCGAGAYLV